MWKKCCTFAKRFIRHNTNNNYLKHSHKYEEIFTAPLPYLCFGH